jgi:flagellin
MTIKINQNMFSRLVQRGLERTTQKLEKSYERLSSGERINSAADDPAGMAVSEGMRFEMQGLRQNQKNVTGAMSLAGTAESQLDELVDLAQRLRELAVQGGNDTLNAGDRRAIQAELNQLLEEMNRIASSAKYNDRTRLDGQFQGVAIQIGTQAGETISIGLSDCRTAALGAGTGTALAAIDVNDAAAAGQAHSLTLLHARLARFYGWSDAEIRRTPWRRTRAYLEAVQHLWAEERMADLETQHAEPRRLNKRGSDDQGGPI